MRQYSRGATLRPHTRVNVRREITTSCSGASSSPLGSRFWPRAAGVVLALATLPSNGLELGQIKVYSAQGEPLDAVVRVYLDPAESLESNCLSAGTQSDFPQSDHILLTDGVRMRLQPDRKAIRITTSQPVQRPAISLAVRARCRQGPVTVRAFNFRLMPPAYQTVSHAGSAAAAGAPMPAGTSPAATTITVKPGDSIYGLCRTIYPHNEKAVRDLALAIVVANPGLFPDGRPRPLEVGEKLTIPDLRAVGRIIEQARARPLAPVRDKASGSSTKKPIARSPAKPKAVQDGKLKLKLARSLDLTRSRNGGGKTPASLPAGPSDSVDVLRSRLSRINEIQVQINARIERLETAVNNLQKAFSSRTNPQSASVTASSVTPSRPGALVPQAARPSGITHARSALWQWAGIGAGVVALALIGFFLARYWGHRRALARRKTRIEEMLEQARVEATPLLGREEAQVPAAAPSAPEIDSDAMSPTKFEDEMQVERTVDLHADQPVTEPSLHPRSVGELPGARSFPVDHGESFAGSGEISTRLRQEMNDALDGTRSMFSDIDRFIALGRIQNAISLLEFQIERHPDDRPSWIKLMAVYRHNGMDEDFDRTYANFREQFGIP